MIDSKNLDQVLWCNKCDCNFNILIDEKDENVILKGYLNCDNCNENHPIIDDIILFDKKIKTKSVKYQSETYSYWWNESHKTLEYDKKDAKKILLSTLSLEIEDFKNKIVLDAGCGNGRFSDIVSESDPKILVIADVSDGIFAAKKKIKDKNLNLIAIKGDLNQIPFRQKVFDIIYSWGVIHHTPDPKFTFENISKFCKLNGKLGIYIYKQNPEYRYNNMHVRLLSILRQYLIIQPLRFISQFLSEKNVIRLFKPIRFIENFFNYGVVGCHTNFSDNKFEKNHYFRVVIDRFKTKYASEHQEHEIISWYKENEFNDLIIGSNPKIGIIGTKKNNEVKEINVMYKYS